MCAQPAERCARRWLEYFFSASLQIMNLAVLTNITDFSTVLCLGGLMATTQLFGLLQEVYSASLVVLVQNDYLPARRQWY